MHTEDTLDPMGSDHVRNTPRTRPSRDLRSRHSSSTRKRSSSSDSDSPIKELRLDTMFRFDTGDYVLGEPVGSGANATVYSAVRTDDQQAYALKLVPQPARDPALMIEVHLHLMREVTAQMCCRHRNVMPLLEYRNAYLDDQLQLAMVMPLATTTLYDLFTLPRRPLDVRSLMQQLLEALAHCHRQRVVHNDLKPNNLLVTLRPNEPPLLQIGDFGRARILMHQETRLRSTQTDGSTDSYRAPEIKLGYEYFDQAVDVWAAGCIFYQMCHPQSEHLFPKAPRLSQTPFESLVRLFGTAAFEPMMALAASSTVQQFRRELPALRVISHSRWLSTVEMFTPLALDVFESACRVDPSRRFSCDQLLALPYFSLKTP